MLLLTNPVEIVKKKYDKMQNVQIWTIPFLELFEMKYNKCINKTYELLTAEFRNDKLVKNVNGISIILI